ncbi:MAG: putative phage abortive infection protein, partial [Bacteroidales bacterium]|nr:putative phage abortive infection protein [Bacteroidales bacterium]
DIVIFRLHYIAFYYGIDENSKKFTINKLIEYNKAEEITNKLIEYKQNLKKEKKINIGRTNQTSLSSYFRNMFNTINFIDKNTILSDEEKHKFIKIYRAQFSDSELFVLYLNVVSRFGIKWKKYDFIINYELIKNIPFDYCDKYPPQDFFKMEYEEDELKKLSGVE